MMAVYCLMNFGVGGKGGKGGKGEKVEERSSQAHCLIMSSGIEVINLRELHNTEAKERTE